jgi:hypothetical protein
LPLVSVDIDISGLYYKPITIINDDSSIVNKFETSLIDDARVVIYDHHMFIILATNVTSFVNPIDAATLGATPLDYLPFTLIVLIS